MNGNNMYPMNNGMNNNMNNGMNNMPNNQPMNQNPSMGNAPMNNGMPMNNNMGQPMPQQPMPQQPMMQQPMPQPVQPQPMGQPMYNEMPNRGPQPMAQPQSGGSNMGLIVGGILLLLIIGAVLIIVLKPFDKDYSDTPSSGGSTSTPYGSTSGGSGGSSSGGSSGYSGGSTTPKTTYKSYTCSMTTVEQNIKFIINVDVKDTSSNAIKSTIKYTLSKTNGQAFTAKEKDAIAKNIETNVRAVYASYGTISGVKSSLTGGKIVVSATLTASGVTATEFISDASVSGFTCK